MSWQKTTTEKKNPQKTHKSAEKRMKIKRNRTKKMYKSVPPRREDLLSLRVPALTSCLEAYATLALHISFLFIHYLSIAKCLPFSCLQSTSFSFFFDPAGWGCRICRQQKGKTPPSPLRVSWIYQLTLSNKVLLVSEFVYF